ncbi:MAG: protein kinase [bacterium]
MTLALGPFDLIEPAGRGAMADVWRAVHRRQQVEVAIKVVTAPSGQQARFRRLFTDELRAVARLDHPAIVRLHDHGEIPPGLDARLPPGAPYLVMSWLGHGSLRDRIPMAWEPLRATLLAILDALAHAHARGVVHRDLKVDNVLFGRHGPVLTDFGLAWQLGHAPDDGEPRRLMGTPNYMAPEQIEGDARALGPWTDLYALGCVAYALATGRPPFDRPGPRAVLRAHLGEPVEPMRTAHPLPAAFERWTRRLLHKHPAARYPLAADAAVALLAIDARHGGRTVTGPIPPIPTEPSESDLTLVAPPTFVSITDDRWSQPRDADRPAVPASWRGPERDDEAPVLLGTGRAVFGLRTIGIRGREAERDALWAALRAAIEGPRLSALALVGPAGQGKSRLAAWIGHRAHELGAALPLHATHARPEGPACGLGPMLARHLRCDGLPADERLTRISARIGDPPLARALAAWFDPAGKLRLGGEAVTLRSETERRRVLTRALTHLAAARPLVIVIDDAQWADDAVRFVEHLFTEAPALPALIVFTARDETGAPALDRLLRDRRVARVPVGPLPQDAHARLIHSLLPLDPELVGDLVERTAGSPIFAEQIIGHWLAVDALEAGPRGFRLAPGAPPEPPTDLEAAWTARLDDALGADDLARRAFEAAAVLGVHFDPAEWTEVLAALALPLPAAAVDRMLDARLLHRDGDRLRFAHGLLREALQRAARDAGRAAAANRACAAVLERDPAADPLRRAEHLLAAGDRLAALAPLAAACARALRRADVPAAQRALTRRTRALRAARLPRLHLAWAENRVLAARLANGEGHAIAAHRRARRAEAGARHLGDRRLLVAALINRGIAACVLGHRHLQDGLTAFDEARALADATGDDEAWIDATTRRGTALLGAGHTDAAHDDYLAARARLGPTPDDALRGEIERKLCDIARRRGDHDAAIAHALTARACFTRIGARWSIARLSNTLGDMHRYRGDFAAAMRAYEELRQLSIELGITIGADYAHANLGLTLIELGRYAEARPLLDRARAAAVDRGDTELCIYMHAALWACDAADADWAAFDARQPHLAPLATGRIHDPDAAMVARHAARLAAEAGQPARAAAARALAIAQLDALGREDDAAALRAERPTTAPAAPLDPRAPE